MRRGLTTAFTVIFKSIYNQCEASLPFNQSRAGALQLSAVSDFF